MIAELLRKREQLREPERLLVDRLLAAARPDRAAARGAVSARRGRAQHPPSMAISISARC
ncbi:MAG: hypothetical protein MZV49_21610 [Rhodopseudomonas palustris]|nr:hypothetical protein [Rhodopseudomonas palustris]